MRCPNQAWEKGGRIYSCADAIAKALERHIGGGRDPADQAENPHEAAKDKAETNGKGSDTVMVGVCPDCHGPLEFESGCSVCRPAAFPAAGRTASIGTQGAAAPCGGFEDVLMELGWCGKQGWGDSPVKHQAYYIINPSNRKNIIMVMIVIGTTLKQFDYFIQILINCPGNNEETDNLNTFFKSLKTHTRPPAIQHADVATGPSPAAPGTSPGSTLA